MDRLSAFPDGTSTTNLYLVPGMPVNADPVWDQRLAEPFRQMDAEGKLALGTYSEPLTGLGLFEHSTVVTNDAYLSWIGTADLLR